jgi:hypothetical protein
VVVRPYEVDNYVKNLCPAGFIVASFPDNEESVGSARYWCVVIGHALRCPWAFMLDDSLRGEKIEKKQGPTKIAIPNADTPGKYSFVNGTALDGVLTMESVIKGLSNVYNHEEKKYQNLTELVGVLAFPRARGTDFSASRDAVTLGNCQNFQCLHLAMLLQKGVNFRRGMFKAADMLFSQECCDRGIGSFLLNHMIHDKHITVTKASKESGAHSPNQACMSPETRGSIPCLKLFTSPEKKKKDVKHANQMKNVPVGEGAIKQSEPTAGGGKRSEHGMHSEDEGEAVDGLSGALAGIAPFK